MNSLLDAVSTYRLLEWVKFDKETQCHIIPQVLVSFPDPHTRGSGHEATQVHTVKQHATQIMTVLVWLDAYQPFYYVPPVQKERSRTAANILSSSIFEILYSGLNI